MTRFKVELSVHFRREAKPLLKKYGSLGLDIANLIKQLETDPALGTPLGCDCYKIRLAVKSKGRGKSGGARVISCVLAVTERVVLLSMTSRRRMIFPTSYWLSCAVS